MPLDESIINRYIADHVFTNTQNEPNKWRYGKSSRDGGDGIGINGIHFDLYWMPGLQTYRLCIGVDQIDSQKSRGTILDTHDVDLLVSTFYLKTGIAADAVGFEEQRRSNFLTRVNEILQFIISNGIQRPKSAPRQPVIIDRRSSQTKKVLCSSLYKNKKKTTPKEGWFEKKAKTMIAAASWGDWDVFNRSIMKFDGTNADQVTQIGESKNYQIEKESDPNYTGVREHAIPCAMILKEAARRVSAGVSVCELADFLKTYLMIVKITKEEQVRMDVELRMKETMPKSWYDAGGWSGGDKFDRLKTASIKLA